MNYATRIFLVGIIALSTVACSADSPLRKMFALHPKKASASAMEHCSPDMSDQAVSSLMEAGKNWSTLLAHQKKFISCDDGELAEDYSEAIVKLFSKQWSQFADFVSISKKSPDFKIWAIDHIDSTTSTDDLRLVEHNAAICLGGEKAALICKAVEESAKNALAKSVRESP